jgi:hypothetical protein
MKQLIYLKSLRFFLALGVFSFILHSNARSQSSGFEWFPEEPLFPTLRYDVLENQVYSGVFVLRSDQHSKQSVYVPVNFGLDKTFFNWHIGDMAFGLALGAASYTQFEIELYDSNTLRGGLLNTDFRASGLIYAKTGQHHFRLHIFHRSSHLGDDYMLRNADFRLNDKSLSYEQLDLIYYYQGRNIGIYAGLAEVISPYVFRERFMIQGGFQGSKRLWGSTDLIYGTDIKVYEENNFLPDIHAGIGLQFNRYAEPQLNIQFDSYYGQLPYSTLDYGTVFWAGLSTTIYLK